MGSKCFHKEKLCTPFREKYLDVAQFLACEVPKVHVFSFFFLIRKTLSNGNHRAGRVQCTYWIILTGANSSAVAGKPLPLQTLPRFYLRPPTYLQKILLTEIQSEKSYLNWIRLYACLALSH